MKYLDNPRKRELLVTFCGGGHKKFFYSEEFKEKVLRHYGFGDCSVHDIDGNEFNYLSFLINKLGERNPIIVLNLIREGTIPYTPEEVVGAFERGTENQLLDDARDRMSALELVDDWLDSEFEAGHLKKLNEHMTKYYNIYTDYYTRQKEKNTKK